MTAEEAWDFILGTHTRFHKYLKQFGYTYFNFVPSAMSIHKMFDQENLTEQDIKKYHDIFVNKIYNVKHLQKFDDIFEKDVKPMLEKAITKFLLPLIPKWNAIMPKRLDILCAYGNGAGYKRESDDVAQIFFRMSQSFDNKYGIFNILFHEFVHLLIQEPVIAKYNVPHDLKERIVDIICYEFVKIPVQKTFENSFANNYITIETIKTDLPMAVERMMIDYNLSQKINNEV